MKIFLIGANGFLGSRIYRELTGSYNSIEKVKIRSIDDVNSFLDYISSFECEIQIINAGWCGVKAQNTSKEFENINYSIQTKLLESLSINNVKRYINFGSYNEYGNLNGLLTEDLHLLNPISEYAKVKYSICKYGLMTSQSNKYLHLRISNIYGEGQINTSLYGTLKSYYLKQEKITLGACDAFRDMLDIEDFVKLFNLILKSNITGVLNVGSGKTQQNREFVLCVADNLEIPSSKINFDDSRCEIKLMSDNYQLSIMKLNKLKLDFK